METAVIVGGNVTGLTAAVALHELGYQVEVLERDSQPVPESVEAANSDWIRPTVPQAQHVHSFKSLAVFLLRERIPEVYAALRAAGCDEFDLSTMHPQPTGEPLPELPFLACRRRTFDQVFATTAELLGIKVYRGVAVSGLELNNASLPGVAGVRLSGGGRLAADLVIDATGRRSVVRHWLGDLGVPVAADRTSPSGIACYTRFYRSLDGELPGRLDQGTAAGGGFGSYLALAYPGDNGTFAIGIGVLPEDHALKAVRSEPVFEAVVRATPLLAPWIAPDVAVAESPVYAITFPDNLASGTAGSAQRPVPGLFQLGDAACVTNPLYGRGVALGIGHAFRLADVLAEYPKRGVEQSGAASDAVEDLLLPWYDRAVTDDLERNSSWRAAVLGEQSPVPPDGRLSYGRASLASMFDPVVWQRFAEVRMSLGHPDEFYDDPDIQARIAMALTGRKPPDAPKGPSRAELLKIVSEAAR